MVRNTEREAEEKRKKTDANKKAVAKSNFEDKVMRENQRRILHEQQVEKMEQEELELIQRLQNTQWIQKAAYEDLEEALAGGDIDLEKLESMQYSDNKRKGKKKGTK